MVEIMYLKIGNNGRESKIIRRENIGTNERTHSKSSSYWHTLFLSHEIDHTV